MRVVETDAYDGDYPTEKFLNLPSMQEWQAQEVCNLINGFAGTNHDRFWKVVDNNYQLQPGFEP